MKKRNFIMAILLTIITCGIYGIYWFIALTDEVKLATYTPSDTSGAMAFVLTLVTCGIYGIYWAYKMGSKLDNFTQQNTSRGFICLLLSLFGLNILACAFIQDTLNKMSNY